jgi:predicted HicB family RNase H-like nuclease
MRGIDPMSTSTFEHKGYVGTIKVDAEAGNLFGRVVNIKGDIFYDGDTLDALEQNMRDAIDGYLVMCQEDGVDPDKPFSGDVRIELDARTHAHLAAAAERRGMSMNQFAVDALKQALGE